MLNSSLWVFDISKVAWKHSYNLINDTYVCIVFDYTSWCRSWIKEFINFLFYFFFQLSNISLCKSWGWIVIDEGTMRVKSIHRFNTFWPYGNFTMFIMAVQYFFMEFSFVFFCSMELVRNKLVWWICSHNCMYFSLFHLFSSSKYIGFYFKWIKASLS